MLSYSRPRSLPAASPPPLPTEMAIITGTFFSAIRLSSTVNNVRSGPSAPKMNGDDDAGNILFRDVNRNLARVGRRMAC